MKKLRKQEIKYRCTIQAYACSCGCGCGCNCGCYTSLPVTQADLQAQGSNSFRSNYSADISVRSSRVE